MHLTCDHVNINIHILVTENKMFLSSLYVSFVLLLLFVFFLVFFFVFFRHFEIMTKNSTFPKLAFPNGRLQGVPDSNQQLLGASD